MNQDFLDILHALHAAHAEFLLVGAHALAVHAQPRATGDLDIYVRPTLDNAAKVWQALAAFGAPMEQLTQADLAKDDTVFQMGLPPNRIDILTGLTGVTFDECWAYRVYVNIQGLDIPCIGKEQLLTNKRALGRPQDLVDAAMLEQST